MLQATELGEIWGIGRRIGKQLLDAGLVTALDVARLDAAMVRARWGVVLERTVRELQGMPCVDMEAVAPVKKEIASTRSFGRPVTQLEDLIEAVTEFAQRAAEKLRRQNGVAGQVAVFVHTSPHRIEQPQYSRATVVPLRRPTADTALLVQAAVRGMRVIYRPGYNMAKAGVHLLDLSDGSIKQGELDLDTGVKDRTHLMTAMDALNRRYGRGTVALASAGTLGPRRTWTMRQDRKTPDYTTCWHSMPLAIA